MRSRLIEPTIEQILRYCAEAPVERVFLEDVARRSQGRFAALAGEDEELTALCHLGSNVVPSGAGCGAFADARGQVGRADADRRGRAPSPTSGRRPGRSCRAPRLDRPGQPVYAITEPPPAGGTGLRPATVADLDLLFPRVPRRTTRSSASIRCAATPTASAGVRATQIEEGRSWLWAEDGVIRFKAEASAWTPARCSCSRFGRTRRRAGRGTRAARCATSSGCCSREPRPSASSCGRRTLAAIRLYETVGMSHVLDYRSVLL